VRFFICRTSRSQIPASGIEQTRSWVEPLNDQVRYNFYPSLFWMFRTTTRSLELRISTAAPASPLPFSRALPFVDDLQLVVKFRNARVDGENHREVMQHALPSRASGGNPGRWTCSMNRLPSWNRSALFPCPFVLLRFPPPLDSETSINRRRSWRMEVSSLGGSEVFRSGLFTLAMRGQYRFTLTGSDQSHPLPKLAIHQICFPNDPRSGMP